PSVEQSTNSCTRKLPTLSFDTAGEPGRESHMSLFHPLRPPGRRRRWRPVAATVAAAALAGTVLAPSASATTDPLPHDQSSTFYSWGTNYNAQIGNGTSPNPYATYTPQSISLPGGVATVEASVGYQFDVAL